MAVDSDSFPDFPPTKADIGQLDEVFETNKPFSDSTPETIMGQLEWRHTRSQGEFLILMQEIGLKPLQTIVVMEVLNEQQEKIETFVRAGLEFPETAQSNSHPMEMPLEEGVETACDDLVDLLSEDDLQLLIEKVDGSLGLSGMDDEDILNRLHSIPGPEQPNP